MATFLIFLVIATKWDLFNCRLVTTPQLLTPCCPVFFVNLATKNSFHTGVNPPPRWSQPGRSAPTSLVTPLQFVLYTNAKSSNKNRSTLYCFCFVASHRRSQDFVWGALFSSKSLRPFLVVAFKRRSKTTEVPKLPHTAKNVLKIDSCSA